jgi:hypothetical protein
MKTFFINHYTELCRILSSPLNFTFSFEKLWILGKLPLGGMCYNDHKVKDHDHLDCIHCQVCNKLIVDILLL